MPMPKGGHCFNWRKHPEIDARLDEIYRGRYSQEIADILNAEFGTSFTAVQINGHLANQGKRTGVGKNRTGHRFFWTPEKEAFVRARLDKTYEEILDEFEKEFGIRLTWGALGHFKWRNGIYSENDGHFKSGHLPHNASDVGAESDRKNGYIWVKVSDERHTGNGSKENWKQKQHVIWEEENGPLPDGMLVAFRDGDTRNFDKDNLVAVTRPELNYMTRMGTKRMEPEARKTGELVCKLKATIYEKEKSR